MIRTVCRIVIDGDTGFLDCIKKELPVCTKHLAAKSNVSSVGLILNARRNVVVTLRSKARKCAGIGIDGLEVDID
ncbi:MAG: hypothetical protein P8N11_10330 [Gammaproteobacteria bacterium]|nr:hypothetical protein [Gammaproteobacteria bacterium]